MHFFILVIPLTQVIATHVGHEGVHGVLALGAPLLLPSLLDKAARQGDIQEFTAVRRLALVVGYFGCVIPNTRIRKQTAKNIAHFESAKLFFRVF